MSETRDNYTVIPGWTKRLGLTLTEKVVYCVIYGFSQDEDSTFHGSRAYLASICECSVDTIDRVLKKLLGLGLISKKEVFSGGVKFCEYSVAASSRNMQGVAANCHEGSRTVRHNNIDNNVDNKLSTNRDKSAPSRSNSFDFKKALLELGVSEQHATDWLAVRKAKRMTNTRTAFDRLKGQIEKACRQYACTADDCVAFAASKDWGGFDASWEQIKEIKTAQSDEDYIRAYFAREEAKFKGGVHF